MRNPAKTYFIGLDTGGTYTDAAILDPENHEVIASAKALTTRGDLSVGLTEAMAAALANASSRLAPQSVGLVAVSTTLATNAVVEGHGSEVGVILVGFDGPMVARTGIAASFPGVPVARVRGGHNHNGDERMPLDMEELERVLSEQAGGVEAFAVAAEFAVRNPDHEHRVRDRIIARTGKPVTTSSELSSALDAPRRALTAVLNARLISRISKLIDAVKAAMGTFMINCPLMVVKGDGTLALADLVASRPLETILSGPAASLVGAHWLSRVPSFIMSDMGGTTTDIAVLAEGRPKISEVGAEIGGWRTMVRAIDVRTVGLGGDSEVAFDSGGALHIGPQRITPVALIGWRFPDVLAVLETELAAPEISSLAGRFIMLPLGARKGVSAAADLSERERGLLDKVGVEPKLLSKVAVSAGALRAVNALRRKGLVQLAGFTPSDAAHVLGLQSNWSKEAAYMAAKLALRVREMRQPATEEGVGALAREIWSEVVRLSGREVLKCALAMEGRPFDRGNGEGEDLLDTVCRGRGQMGLANVAISPSVPVIAVGGPVKVYYGEVARRLKAEVIFPDFCDVANAVGAATGVIARTSLVHVVSDGGGIFRIHGAHGTEVLNSPEEALRRAEHLAKEAARSAALAMGSEEPKVSVTVDKHLLPEAVDDRGLFSAKVAAEAVGRPLFGTSPAKLR